jgi:hypothetical protein
MSEQEQIERIWQSVQMIAARVDEIRAQITPAPVTQPPPAEPTYGLLSRKDLLVRLSVGGKPKSMRWLDRQLSCTEWRKILKPVRVGLAEGYRNRDVERLLEYLER